MINIVIPSEDLSLDPQPPTCVNIVDDFKLVGHHGRFCCAVDITLMFPLNYQVRGNLGIFANTICHPSVGVRIEKGVSRNPVKETGFRR